MRSGDGYVLVGDETATGPKNGAAIDEGLNAQEVVLMQDMIRDEKEEDLESLDDIDIEIEEKSSSPDHSVIEEMGVGHIEEAGLGRHLGVTSATLLGYVSSQNFEIHYSLDLGSPKWLELVSSQLPHPSP